MEHENIVKFYGICVEPNKVCTVYSHCPKGSLQDVLQNEKLNLDVMFQQSFITDMVKVSHTAPLPLNSRRVLSIGLYTR